MATHHIPRLPALHERVDANRIAARIRLARRDAGLLSDEVTARLGRPPGYVADLEAGRRLPLLSDVVALAGIYGVDVEFLRPDSPRGAGPQPLHALEELAGGAPMADAA